MSTETLKEFAKRIGQSMQCNCDLDNWEPEPSTGHSWVCRIHKKAMADFKAPPIQRPEQDVIPSTPDSKAPKTPACFRDGKWHVEELANTSDKLERDLIASRAEWARFKAIEKAAREYFTASQIVMTTDEHTETEHFNAIIARDALRKALTPPTEGSQS